ncbi:MAG: DUF378 domain-containing protein [Bacillaceae bacterium]
MEVISWIAFFLVVVGALNWLLFAFNYNLVSALFSKVPALEKTIYVLVGLSGLFLLYEKFM